LTPQDRIKWCIRYANPIDAETWLLLPSQTGSVYQTFKDEVLALYPGIDSDRKYTVNDLERLVSEYQIKKTTNKEALGEYHRDFMRISMFLLNKTRISDRERNRWYLQGFHLELRDRILQRLAIVEPTINPDDSYSHLEVHKAALFILNSSLLNSSGTDSGNVYSLQPSSSNPIPRAPTPSATIVKTETHDTDVLRQIQIQLSALTQAIAASPRASTISQSPATAPNNIPINHAAAVAHLRPGQAVLGGSTGFCLFCGTPAAEHIMRNCPVAEQYVRDGKCSRKSDGRIVLPNSDEIPRGLRGRWFKDRLDTYHELFPGKIIPRRDTPPHLTAALYEIAADTEVLQFEVSRIEEVEDEEDPDLVRVSVLQSELKKAEEKVQEKKKRKSVRFDGVQVPTLPTWAKGKGKVTDNTDIPPPMVPIPAAKSSDAPSDPKPSSPNPGNTSKPPSTPDALKSAKPPHSSSPATRSERTEFLQQSNNGPQYRYQAAIEDPNMARVLLDRALDAPIQTTPRELLATSPDLRKQFKEMVMSKRVSSNAVLVDPDEPIQTVESFLHEHASRYHDPPVVAATFHPLRVVYPEFDRGIRPECLLDGGAQIIAMRKDIWEQLDLPLMCEKVMVMESANNTRNSTLGVVQDVRVRFGPVTLQLQVQVVEDAPFEVLLGMPFFSLTSCLVEYQLDGECFITLQDPNTGERAKFTTHPRRQRGRVIRPVDASPKVFH
jgi:hypothetical protein